MTLQSFSQTDTDSLVCLPKSYLIRAIQELKYGDLCKVELKSTQSLLTNSNLQLTKKDSVITNYKRLESSYKREILDLNNLVEVQDQKIELYIKQAKREKRKRIALITAGSVVIVGTGTAIIWLSTL